MAITLRQTYRLLRRYRDGGASAIANQRRGRPSNNRLPDVVRDHAIALVRERYADFGPTFAAEKLAERDDLRVSREMLRNWMRQAGIWMSRAERKRIQQPRHRREHIGELVQIDGSEHRWFEDRAAACTLLVFIDDATSRHALIARATIDKYAGLSDVAAKQTSIFHNVSFANIF
jgi:transposase